MKTVITIAAALLISLTVGAQDLTSTNMNGVTVETTMEDTPEFLAAKATFVDYPTLRLNLNKKSLKIDPRQLEAFGNFGYFYPETKITGEWGVLTVTGKLLFSSDFQTVTLSIPREIKDNTISGDDWSLTFNDNYYVMMNQKDKNFYLFRSK